MDTDYLGLDEYLYLQPSTRVKLITHSEVTDLYLEIEEGKHITLYSSKIEKTNTCINVKYTATVKIVGTSSQSITIEDQIFALQAKGITITGNIHEIGEDNKGTYEFILLGCTLQGVHINGILEFYGTDGYFHYLDIHKPHSRLFYILREKALNLFGE